MKPGQKVKVFQRPLTDKEYEGIAYLRRFLYRRDGYETWEVEFIDDLEMIVPRVVHSRNLIIRGPNK